MSTRRSVVLAVSLSLVLVSGSTRAFDFRDLWQTPDQRAARLLENDQVEALIEDAPDARWRGIGLYQSGDYAAAAEAFGTDAGSSEPPDLQTPEVSARQLDSLYNQATALTRSGEYDKAISLLDQVIEQQPDALDAQQNRSVAQMLRSLDEQQQEPRQGGEGESGKQGDGGEADDANDSGKSSDSSESDEQAESQEGKERSADSPSSSDTQASNSESGASESPEQSQGDRPESPAESGDAEMAPPDADAMQEAADALAAAAERDGEDEGDSENESSLGIGGDDTDAPISEDDQAVEQWLRRIPDDPAGLLRRKLEQSHRTEYPEVRDAQRAW